MKRKHVTFGVAFGSVCAISFAALPIAHAHDNPFQMRTLQNGYLLADASDAKEKSKKQGEAECKEAGQGDKTGANAAGDKCKQENLSAESSKVKSGWCGDGGRCGYKRRE